MSRVEEGNLFFNRFSRVAIALSTVTSSFVLANTGVVSGVNGSGPVYLTEGETNSSTGFASDGSASIDINGSISGAIVAGSTNDTTTTSGGSSVTTRSFLDANGSRGFAAGLDVNETTVTSVLNRGSISASATTLSSFDPNSANANDTVHPDVNSTNIVATGINVSAASADLNLINRGDVTATATINNESKNSQVAASAVNIVTPVTAVSNEGDITATGTTQSSYLANDGTTTVYPDQNNSSIDAAGIFVGEASAISGAISNSGTISATADIYNDTNNSRARAAGMVINSAVDKGIVNTGSISATATTRDKVVNADGTTTINTVATIGGKTGTSGTIDTSDFGTPASYVTSNINDDDIEHHVSRETGSDADTYVRDSANDIHTGTFTPEVKRAPGDLNNTIVAEGIAVKAAVTGGLDNQNYISSVLVDATIDGDATDGTNNGIVVSANTGTVPVGTAADINESQAKTDDEIQDIINNNDSSDVNATVEARLANTGSTSKSSIGYEAPTANNGSLPESDTHGTDAEAAVNDYLKTNNTDTNTSLSDTQQTALDGLPDNIRLAYLKAPDESTDIAGAVQAEIDEVKEANQPDVPANTPPADATDGWKDGTHIARIGNTVVNANVTGAASGNGILVRAVSDTSLEGNITSGGVGSTAGLLDANGSITNAGVTSGRVESYLGEGTDSNGNSRRVTLANDRVTNDLIGGVEINEGVTVKGDGAAAGVALNSAAFSDSTYDGSIDVKSYKDSNGNLVKIVSDPISIVGVGKLVNNGTIASANGSGLELLSKASGKLEATDANLTGAGLEIKPVSVTTVREFLNTGTIARSLGGNAINGKSTAEGAITAKDINQSASSSERTDISVVAHSEANFGNFINAGEISESLGEDALKLEAAGSSELVTESVTDSNVTIGTTSIGGVRKVYGKDGNKTKLTDGNLINVGEIKASLAANAVNMHSEGSAKFLDEADTTTLTNSNVLVTNKTITGVEGNFVNIAATDINKTTLKKSAVARGTIKASLAADAVLLDAKGTASLTVKSITGGTTEVINESTSGVGSTFANYGEIASALAADGVDLSGVSEATLGDAAGKSSTITSANVTVRNIVNAGTGSDFINGASALETGAIETNTTVQVHNPKDNNTGNFIKQAGYYTVAANINENNTSDTNSTGSHPAGIYALDPKLGTANDGVIGDVNVTNNNLVDASVSYYNKEAAITSGKITASLAADAVKFQGDATGDLKVLDINRTTTARVHTVDGTDTTYATLDATRSNVESVSISDVGIDGNFINNGEISVSLAANGVNGTANATGTLGDSANGTSITASSVSQITKTNTSIAGDFINEAISREVGNAKAFAALATNGYEEVGAFTYDRATNKDDVKITASLASDAVELEAHANNKIDLKDVNNGSIAVVDRYGSGNLTDSEGNPTRTLSTVKADAAATKSVVSSTTEAHAGVSGNFSNTGTISASLAANGFDALADGTNVLGDSTNTFIKGSIVSSDMNSTSGVQGNFTNDVHSLRTGAATLIAKDVYDMDADGKVAPRYFEQNDLANDVVGEEGRRVKSNVIDRVVYNRVLAKGEITTSLAADAIKLDAKGSNDILANTIGASNIDVVLRHINYTNGDGSANTSENNASRIDDVQTIKVTSNVTSNSTVRAGIGGKFSNKNAMSTSLAANVISAEATGATTIGKTGETTIEGGVVTATTNVYAGIGNGANASSRGFLNAAGTYDDGAVQIGHSQVIAGRNNNNGANTTPHLLTDIDANSDLNKTDSDLSLALINSEDVEFWNKTKVVGEMKTSLAKDVVKVDGTSTGKILGTISSVTGDVNVTADNAIVAVQGHYVSGDAKANVTETTNTFAGINGDFTNQGKISASLAGHGVNAEGTATGTVGDAATAITGSTVTQSTNMTAGIQGDFRNEVLSLDLGNGKVLTTLGANDVETPKVYFDKVTTDGEVEISTSLAKSALILNGTSTNSVLAGTIKSSDAVLDSHSVGDSRANRTVSTVLADALTAKSKVDSSANTTAGLSGDFYNTGVIKASLAKEAFDATANSTNTLGDSESVVVTASDVTATSETIAGIGGDFLNDVVSLDDGAKKVVQRDVYDANGNPVYQLSADSSATGSAPGDRIKSNVIKGVYYGQKIVQGEISTSLAGDAVKLDATGTNNLNANIGTADVRVVRLTDSTTGLRSTADANLTVKVTSDATATTTVVAGIGGSFTNKSSKEIKTSLSKNAITAIATATTNLGNTSNTITGGTTEATTTVVAGIGHKVENEKKGLYNLASSYNDGAVKVATTQLKRNNTSATVISADANDHVATDTNNSLPLIDSEEVVYWDKTKVVGKISTSLAKDTFNLEGTSTGNLTPLKIESATNDVNVTTDGGTTSELIALTGYHVAGTARANVSETTVAYAGVNGEFKNQGEISTSLSGNVINAKGSATGTLGDVGTTEIIGSTVTNTAEMFSGIDGDFTNEVQSLDTTGHVGTKLVGTTESSLLYFDKTTTSGDVKLSASLSKDVVLADALATNNVTPKSIKASAAIIGSDASDIIDALTARSIVEGTTKSIGGINGNFYNTGTMEASLSGYVLTSQATSDNNLGTSAVVIQGSKVTANGYADARIKGDFTNDAKLFDTGAAQLLMKKEPVDGNDSNVIDTITYDQELVVGTLKSGLSEAVLSSIATGTNSIDLAEVGNSTVKVVSVGTNEITNAAALQSHAATDVNVSSNVTAKNEAYSGITGKFVNAGTIETGTKSNVLEFQAIGGAADVKIAKITGGSVDATNIVLSGINLDGNSTDVGFLNDKRDFNTVLATDDAYDSSKVATGTITAALAFNAIDMTANGGVTTDVTADSAHIETTNDNGTYDVARVTNTGSNRVVIEGDFVNRGDITTGTTGKVLNLSATNTLSNDVKGITDKGLLSSTANATVTSLITGDLINSGEMSTGAAGTVINIESIGGDSLLKGTLADDTDGNITKWAGANGEVVAKAVSFTKAGFNDLNNTGTIKSGGAAAAISLVASGIANSDGFTENTDVDTAANNAVIVNNLTSTASIGNVYNIGTIESGGAESAITASAEGGAITAIADSSSDLIKSYEDTKATVSVSIGNLLNDAVTVQNKLWEVNKAFNTDGNETTDDQLKPLEATVIANRGEYDAATGAKVDTNTSTYSTATARNALAYDDNNSSKKPILTQTVGTITAGGAAAAIALSSKVDATNTDDESTVISATIGNIDNKGIIGTGATTIGIDLSADGHAGVDAIAKTTAGTITNYVTDDKFTNAAGDVLHAVVLGQIEGTTHGIKLTSNIDGAAISSADDQNRSVVKVASIINKRLILDKGDEVVSGEITNALNNNDVTTQADNYSTEILAGDTVYSAVIKGATAIEVGGNVEVTNGIHNYGTIDGDIKLGSADLHLYGIVQNADKNETYGKRADIDNVKSANYFATHGDDINGTANAAYITALGTDYTQEAGIVTGDITDAFVGSSINYHNSHIMETAGATYTADSIVVKKDAILNVGEDTTFVTNNADNTFNSQRSGKFINEGILNVRAGKKVTITGDYVGVNAGLERDYTDSGKAENFVGRFVTNVKATAITTDANNVFADGNFGQLEVSGNADLSGGIGVRVDDRSLNLLANTTTETRLVDVVKAATLSSGDANLTHSGGNTKNAVGISVVDNVSSYDFQAVEGTTKGDIDLILVKQAVKSVEEGGLVIDTPRVAIETTRNFSSIIDTRIDMESGYLGKIEGSDIPAIYLQSSGRGTEQTSKGGSATIRTDMEERDGENAGENANVQPSFFDKTNYWIKPFVGISQQDSTNNIAGYDTTTYGLAAGADKEYGEWFVGLAGALAKSSASSTSGPSSSTDTRLFQGTLYGSKRVGDGILNLQAGLGFLDNDRTRYAEAEGTNVDADYNGYVVQAKALYEEAFVANKDTLLIPYVSGEIAHVKNDGYTEKGASGAVQTVDSVSSDAAILSVGTRAKYKVSENSSVVGTVGIGYDFLAKEQEYSTTYVAAGETAILNGAKPDKFEYDLGLAYQVETDGGTQVKMGVDYKGRNGYDSTVGSVRFYFPF